MTINMTHAELVGAAKVAIDAVAHDRNVSIGMRQESLSELIGEIEGHQESLAEEYSTRNSPTEPATEDRYREF